MTNAAEQRFPFRSAVWRKRMYGLGSLDFTADDAVVLSERFLASDDEFLRALASEAEEFLSDHALRKNSSRPKMSGVCSLHKNGEDPTCAVCYYDPEPESGSSPT